MEEIEVADVFLLSITKGILTIDVKKGTYVDLEMVKQVISTRKELQKGKGILTLLDLTKSESITKEAREYTSGREVDGLDIAMAAVIASLPMRILANFFINFDRPPAPTKMFTSHDKALAWLETHR